jgi:tetratricopeptide (TPR) repeat protein
LQKLDKHEEAITWYDKALEIDPENLYSLSYKSVALHRLFRLEEAVEYYYKVSDINATDANAWVNLGLCLYDLDRYEQSLDSFSNALLIDPRHLRALFNMGRSLSELEKYEKAIQYYDKVLDIEPNYVPALYKKSEALTRLGRREESASYLSKASKIDPNYHFHELLDRSLELISVGRRNEALEIILKAQSIVDTYNIHSLNNLGTLVEKMGKHQEAIEWYDKALALNPQFIISLYNKGSCLQQLGNHKEALECYDKVLEVEPNHLLAIFNKGQCLENLGNHKEALECYDKVLDIDPNFPGLLFKKGKEMTESGKHEEAIEYFDKILSINPNDEVALRKKVMSLNQLRRYEETINCYDKLLELNPEETNEILLEKGRSLTQLGENSEAIECYDTVLSNNSNNIEALHGKGLNLHVLRKPDDALACYDKALSIDAQNATILGAKGALFESMRNYGEAIKCYDKALSIDPNEFHASINKPKVLDILKKEEEYLEPINDDEHKSHGEIISKALVSELPDRWMLLLDGIMKFGLRLPYTISSARESAFRRNDQEIADAFQKLYDEYFAVLKLWLAGDLPPRTIDERERRVRIAMEIIHRRLFDSFGLRIPALAILSLPTGHPLRDKELARQALHRHMEVNTDPTEVLLAISGLLKYEMESAEKLMNLIQKGVDMLAQVRDSAARSDFLLSAFQVCINGVYGVHFAVHSLRLEDNLIANRLRQRWLGASEKIFQIMEKEELGSREKNNVAGLLAEAKREYAKAADYYSQNVDLTNPTEEFLQLRGAFEAGRLFNLVGQYKKVIEILTPYIEIFERMYLLAVEDSEVLESGSNFVRAVTDLSFAYAAENEWEKSINYLNRSNSLRLRFLSILRGSNHGSRLLEIQTALYTMSRGLRPRLDSIDIPKGLDWIGQRVSLISKAQEEYRKTMLEFDASLVESPTISQMSSMLGKHEAAVVLGMLPKGLLIAIFVNGDRTTPSGHFLLEEWPIERLAQIFVGRQNNGWLDALSGSRPPDVKKGLEKLLQEIEHIFGDKLISFFKDKKIHKITIIPHRWLHMVPYWALDSLKNFEIMVAPDTTSFMNSTRNVMIQKRGVLVVSDPTEDLAISVAEADSLKHNLDKLNFEVKHLNRELATEENVIKALKGTSILHFCGHGRTDPFNWRRTSLYLSYDGEKFHFVDPIVSNLPRSTVWTQSKTGERFADIDGVGRIYEKLFYTDTKHETPHRETGRYAQMMDSSPRNASPHEPTKTEPGSLIERRLEYSESGTLYALYVSDGHEERRIILAELLTTEDIMFGSNLKDCKLAFLSACESGGVSVDARVDEYSGVPAAMHLAGVSVVVATLWPVDEVFTALYVNLFYEEFARTPKSISLLDVIKNIRHRLQKMKKEEAAALLDDMSRRTSYIGIKGLLRMQSNRILKSKEPFPFHHPYYWASFFIAGKEKLFFEEAEVL